MKRALGSVLCASVLALGGCTADWAKQNDSAILFEIGQIRASSATVDQAGGGSSNILYSDVSQVINDDIILDINVFQKNPNISAASPNNHVYLDTYRIRYFRTDGRNVEGVDVPHTITGPLSMRIHTPSSGTEQEVSVNVTAVRHQAKLEPPLVNMSGGHPVGLPGGGFSGAAVLTTIAEVTVFGRTLTGSSLTATGRIQVTFADFVD